MESLHENHNQLSDSIRKRFCSSSISKIEFPRSLAEFRNRLFKSGPASCSIKDARRFLNSIDLVIVAQAASSTACLSLVFTLSPLFLNIGVPLILQKQLITRTFILTAVIWFSFYPAITYLPEF